MPVPAGTQLTFDVKGQAGQWIPRSPGEIRAQVINTLSPNFHVYDVTMIKGSDSPVSTGFGYWNWSFTAVVTLQTRESYNYETDVASIVANAFYHASGTMPAITTRGFGPQPGQDVDNSPSLFGMVPLLALGAIAVAAIIYLPKPSR